MYRLGDITEVMKGRVGFHQTNDPDLPQLLDSITQSPSNLFLQDTHPLLTTNNLYQAAQNFSAYNYPEWEQPEEGESEYDEGTKVQKDNVVYESSEDENETVPGEDDSWLAIDLFSLYLMNMRTIAAQKTLAAIFENKKVDRNTKSLFENIYLFDNVGNRRNTVIKEDRFVGFQIRLRKHKHIAALIRKIGTQFTASIPDPINLYLYHSSQDEPVMVIPIEVTKSNSFEWRNIEDIILCFSDQEYDSGGVFFLGYYESDIPFGCQAVTRDNYTFGKPMCRTCGSDYRYFSEWSKYMDFMPFVVSSEYLSVGRTLFNIDQVAYYPSTTFGLNFHLTVKCDLTEFLIENVDIMDQALANHLAYEFINSFSYTLRDNADAKQIREKAAFEMTRTDVGGINPIMLRADKALSFDFSGFNTACLPCNKPGGIRIGAI